MGMVMKLLLVLLLASGIAYYLVPLLTSGRATELQPVSLAQASGGRTGGSGSSADKGRTISAIATIESVERTPHALKSGGLVTAVSVQEGATVRAGQVLVELDASDLRFSGQSAKLALEDAIARVERTNHELALAAEKAKNARDTARDAAAEANERLRQAEQDARQGQEKADSAVREARAAVTMAEAKLSRALHMFNRARNLAKLEPVAAGPGGELKVPARPSVEGFDDSLLKYNDYVDSELSFAEALIASENARQAVGKAEMARTHHRETSSLAVGIAEARQKRAEREAGIAEAALVAQEKSAEFTRSQVQSALKAAQLENERFDSMLERMTVRASEADDGATVAEVLVRRGDTVSAGTRAVVLHRPDKIRARCQLPVDRLPQFRQLAGQAGAAGIPVRITTSAFDGSSGGVGQPVEWTGTVSRYSGTINPSSVAFMAEVSVNPAPVGVQGDMAEALVLQPGMVIRVEFGAKPGQ